VSESEEKPRVRGWKERAPLVALLLLVLASAVVRFLLAVGDPAFDREHPEGMLKSDPALLYWFTERILDAGGLPPADFRADRHVEYPETTDLPATFTIGQEFLVAWSYELLGGGEPLHLFCVRVMALCAALVAVGVYGLARALGHSGWWSFFAAAGWALLPASHRTVGFILIREDLALPLLALHLALLARAGRRGGAPAFGLAGIALVAALATWHAMVFVVTLEAVAFLAAYLVDGRNPLRARGAWVLPLVVVAGSLVVPVLRAKAAWGSTPVAIAVGLALVALLEHRRAREYGGAVERVAAVGLAAGGAWLGASLRGDAYAHVGELVWAKLRYLGMLPADPLELSFDARLLWQGPFDTASPLWLAGQLGPALLGLLAVRLLWRERRALPLLLGTLLALGAAWMVERLVILPALVLPVLGVLVLVGIPSASRRRWLAALLLAAQAALFTWTMAPHENPSYRPLRPQGEPARMVEAVERLVPEGEAVASDFMSSTAILAHTGHPILLQPKYETQRSRDRARELLTRFFHRPPEALREWMLEHDCRYAVFDRFTLGYLSPYLAGLPARTREYPPGSAASLFLSRDQAVLESVPGFELLYRSPPDVRQRDGTPYDLFRLYRLREDEPTDR